MYSNIWRGSDTCTVHHKWDTTLRAVVTKYGLIYIFWRWVWMWTTNPFLLTNSSKGNKIMLSCKKNPWQFMVAKIMFIQSFKHISVCRRKNMLQVKMYNTSPFTGGPSLVKVSHNLFCWGFLFIIHQKKKANLD